MSRSLANNNQHDEWSSKIGLFWFNFCLEILMVIKASLKPDTVYFYEYKYLKYYRDGSSGQTFVWPCLHIKKDGWDEF